MTPERRGEEFRDDLRAPGARNAQARRLLTPDELAPLTRLSTARSLLALGQTFAIIAAAIVFAVATWPSPWIGLSVVAIGISQHAFFILAHEAAHYRLFAHRGLNDAVGRALGMAGGISMCTYRVTLHPTCHSLRVLELGDRPRRRLQAVQGLELVPLEEPQECCGFGGTFAIKNADTSMAMLSDKLRHLLATRAEVCTAVDTSCLMHIGGALTRQRAGMRTMHFAEILAARE